MIVKPKFRGFICTTSHPTGCREHVKEQIEYIKSMPKFKGPKKVLVIGASTGYGLASRIAASFGGGADTIGVFFERSGKDNKTGSAGWYNSIGFEEEANKHNIKAYNINGDAFSDEVKNETLNLIKEKFGKVDCVIYSLASPKRLHPKTNELSSSVLKPIGTSYESKTVDFHTGSVTNIKIDSATEEEIEGTVSVMGGEDWEFWIDALIKEDLICENFVTLAYSYVGPSLTFPIYREGTVGRAKDHLEDTADKLQTKLEYLNGKAYVSVNKAVVTQSSAAIPVVPLYIALLFKLMKENGTHEGCIEQMYRLFSDELNNPKGLDEKRRIRLDNLEMDKTIQDSISLLWKKVDSDNINEISDVEGYRKEFFKLFGFEIPNVDYEAEVDA